MTAMKDTVPILVPCPKDISIQLYEKTWCHLCMSKIINYIINIMIFIRRDITNTKYWSQI